jgi:hypothetical protein
MRMNQPPLGASREDAKTPPPHPRPSGNGTAPRLRELPHSVSTSAVGHSISRFFRRLSPFPFAGVPVVASDAALDHFVAPAVACDDESGQVATAETKRAERCHDDELQQVTHCSLDIGHNAPGLVAAQELARRSPAHLIRAAITARVTDATISAAPPQKSPQIRKIFCVTVIAPSPGHVLRALPTWPDGLVLDIHVDLDPRLRREGEAGLLHEAKPPIRCRDSTSLTDLSRNSGGF